MKVLLVDIDSLIPNLALMKLSAWHKARGDEVGFNVTDPDLVYASVIFKKNAHLTDGLSMYYPRANILIGGTGHDLVTELNPENERLMPDYSIYPKMNYSLGFTTRGCIRKCHFCVVPQKEGKLQCWQHPKEFHNPAFKEIMILDNNWLADREWFFETSNWIIERGLALHEHGMDIRLVDDEIAEQLARIKWANKLHFAFDSENILEPVKSGIDCLKRAGISVRRSVLFYVYVDSDDEYESGVKRCRQLKEYKTTPFVMFNVDKERTRRIKNLQRWANRPALFWSMDIEQYGKVN
jgi:hypothetical protein